MTEEKKPPKSSDPPDPTEEREEFVRGVLHKCVEFTEELIEENQQMRKQLLELQADNQRLCEQVKSDDAMRDLMVTVEKLEDERVSLLDRSSELETQRSAVEDRHQEVEGELNDLASLYVASYQLSLSLAPRKVVQHICELLEQLVGCEAFGVYLVSDDGRFAVPIGGRRMPAGELREEEVSEGPMADVVLTGIPKVRDNPEQSGIGPIAVLPLMVSGTVVGLVKVLRLLPHKKLWAPVDKEFFKLLSIHASTSLVAASLYDDAASPRAALAPLRELFARTKPVEGGLERDKGADHG